VFHRHRDVLDGRLDGEQIGEHLAAGKGREGKRANEFLGSRGHHHLHLMALLQEQASQFRRLVGCDSTSDAQNDLHR
jgi:hypothetical protein